jgi:histidine triad (HIT) family protein
MEDCVFCKIVSKQIPAKIEHEDDFCVVFHDLNPKANTHLLIIPKKHIPTIKDVQTEDEATFGRIINVARKMGQKFNLEDYKLLIRVGKKGGQEVFHVHLHLLSQPS